MRFDVITLFPELFGPHLTQGITRRAFDWSRTDASSMRLACIALNRSIMASRFARIAALRAFSSAFK